MPTTKEVPASTRDLFPGKPSSGRIGDPTYRIAAPESTGHEAAS
ncbi:MAG: hypothetical protein OXI07_01920 [Gammaproteobacteria bacterium]|nr:hypothetical protein [Gammaproteobacteria bacterium]